MEVILGSETQSEARHTRSRDDVFDESEADTPIIPRIIGGTFAPRQAGRQPLRARAKRSWIWDWGIRDRKSVV